MPLNSPCNCEKSGHESTGAERNKREEKTYSSECPANVDLHLALSMSQILVVVSYEPLASMLGLKGWKATLVTVELLSLQQLNIHHFLIQFEI